MIFGTTNWLAWIILGGLAGLIAKIITPGRDPQGCIVTVVLGIAGALVAGWLGRALQWYGPNDSAGFLAAILGAIILLVIWRLVTRGR